MSHDGAPDFRKLDEEVVHRGYVMEVVVGSFEAPDGRRFTRDIVHHPGAVAVVPLHDDGTITVVRQWRAPVDAQVLEIPAGLRDVSGEAPEATAARELAEEVGLEAESFELLATFHNAVGHSDELVHVYLATGLRSVPADVQGPEEEAMAVERHPIDELAAMIGRGELTDGKTIIGVSLVQLRR